MDMPEFLTLEACFIIAEVVVGKGYVMVTTCPPDFSVSDGN